MSVTLDEKQLEQILIEIARISRGGTEYPAGFEALCMSIEGEGRPGINPLSSAIRSAGQNISDSITDLADAIRYMADKNER